MCRSFSRFPRQRLKRPFQFAGLRVYGKNGAGRSFRLSPILACPPYEQGILVHGRRLQNGERPFVVGRVPLIDVENSAIGKPFAFLAAVGVDRV